MEVITARFADYDYRLLFERLNEVVNPNAKNLWYGDSDSYKALKYAESNFCRYLTKSKR